MHQASLVCNDVHTSFLRKVWKLIDITGWIMMLKRCSGPAHLRMRYEPNKCSVARLTTHQSHFSLGDLIRQRTYFHLLSWSWSFPQMCQCIRSLPAWGPRRMTSCVHPPHVSFFKTASLGIFSRPDFQTWLKYNEYVVNTGHLTAALPNHIVDNDSTVMVGCLKIIR